jgi:4,5-dihydroxyphthalate decarboxylase
MSQLSLSLALDAYDHVRDLSAGAVPVEGIALTTVQGPIEDVLYRTHNHAEFDVAELGMGGYVARLSRGEQPYVAIPVFTSRMFRHSCVYVRKDAGIHSPKDLNGRRIGMPEWGMAAAVWARGMLVDEYGLDTASVQWVQGGLKNPGRVDRSPPDPRLGLNYQSRSDRSLDELLMAGELDALFSAREPASFRLPDSPVQRLFQNLQQTEADYWRRTGVLPIMHMIGIRRDIYEKHRWVAQELTRAFTTAKDRSLARAMDTAGAHFPVPLMLHAVQTARAIGGDDFWPYGVDANRVTLDTFLHYAHAQGITSRRLSVDELFAPETLSSTRT